MSPRSYKTKHDPLSQIEAVGSCSNPIRIRTVGNNPLNSKTLLVACKDRRGSVCPACSHTYKGDAWQVVSSGISGGKGVPIEVAGHPFVFVTLTAPSFGPVHREATIGSPVCRHGGGDRCVHGVAASCDARHEPGDPMCGQPICGECFDYEGAVVWNANLGLLWANTFKRLVRAINTDAKSADQVRVSYARAVEFQKRGLVHLHVVMRSDAKSDGSVPDGVGEADMIAAIGRVSMESSATCPISKRVLRWGERMTVTPIEVAVDTSGEDEEQEDRYLAIASYIAKYATKTADAGGALAYRIRSDRQVEQLRVNGHYKRLVATAWELGKDRRYQVLGLKRSANMFGYRGHILTKSRHYSTTFGALRQRRIDYCRNGHMEQPEGSYEYAGRGYDRPSTSRFAYEVAKAATAPRERP